MKIVRDLKSKMQLYLSQLTPLSKDFLQDLPNNYQDIICVMPWS